MDSTKKELKKIRAFEMWTYRRILGIHWSDRITNEEVLARLGKTSEITKVVKMRKLAYLGHILRNEKYRILVLVLQGKKII